MYNTQECGRAYVYEARLYGVDGAGNVALLYIDSDDCYNRHNPVITKRNPHLVWGNSCDYKEGEVVYSIGDTLAHTSGESTGVQQFISGVVVKSPYTDATGFAQTELIATNLAIYAQNQGLPILDKGGRVIGMQTVGIGLQGTGLPFGSGDGLEVSNRGAFGPTEAFIRRVIEELKEGEWIDCCDAYPKGAGSKNVQIVRDATGHFYRYDKAYAGIAWSLVSARTYDTDIDAKTGQRNVRFDPITGALLSTPRLKDIKGIQVLAVAGDSSVTYVSVPGGSTSTIQVQGALTDSFPIG